MIAQELEVSLHMAFVEARQQRHEFITVEHLLLALLDNPSAADVLRACAAHIEDLRPALTTRRCSLSHSGATLSPSLSRDNLSFSSNTKIGWVAFWLNCWRRF